MIKDLVISYLGKGNYLSVVLNKEKCQSEKKLVLNRAERIKESRLCGYL
jgi:hypothetical protein